jgi:hypothetical protein
MSMAGTVLKNSDFHIRYGGHAIADLNLRDLMDRPLCPDLFHRESFGGARGSQPSMDLMELQRFEPKHQSQILSSPHRITDRVRHGLQ